MRRDRRKNFRVEWNVPATIYDVGRHLERPCILLDISNGGAKIAGVRAHTIPDEFRLRTPWATVDRAGLSGVPKTPSELSSLTISMARTVQGTGARRGNRRTPDSCERRWSPFGAAAHCASPVPSAPACPRMKCISCNGRTLSHLLSHIGLSTRNETP
jgi:hypothetical protein